MGKPSERRNFKEEYRELDLTPMMNLIAILIPCLLISVAFVEMAVVKVATPSMGDSSNTPPPADEEPPLNLAVTISKKGYLLNSTVGYFEANGAPGLFIPTVQRSVPCNKFLGTVPPPRAENANAAPCKTNDPRPFQVYDAEGLRKALVATKDKFPNEQRVIITAESNLEFEAVTAVIDISRDVEEPDGSLRTLFDEVVFRPSP